MLSWFGFLSRRGAIGRQHGKVCILYEPAYKRCVRYIFQSPNQIVKLKFRIFHVIVCKIFCYHSHGDLQRRPVIYHIIAIHCIEDKF